MISECYKAQKMKFSLKISSVNVTDSAVSMFFYTEYGFCYIRENLKYGPEKDRIWNYYTQHSAKTILEKILARKMLVIFYFFH